MKCVLLMPLLLLAAADPPVPARPPATTTLPVFRVPEAAGVTHLSLMHQPSGDPILIVKYPWSQHRRPSIEMRLLEDDRRDASVWKPIFFVGNYLTGDALKAIYYCLDAASNLPATGTFTKDTAKLKVDFEVLGQRNSLSRPAVVTLCDSKLEGPRGGTRLIFWPLEDWAVDRDALWLELPKKNYSKPCRFRVWFLREDDIVWAETFSWPGYPEKPAPQAKAKAQPAH